MSAFSHHLIPAIIIFISNIFSGSLDSKYYNFITAIFGWTVAIFMPLMIISHLALIFYSSPLLINIQTYIQEIFYFSLVTVLSRAYEPIVKPYAMKLWSGWMK